MNAIAVFGARGRPGALSVLAEFQRGVVHTEPDLRRKEVMPNEPERPAVYGAHMTAGASAPASDADKDAGCGLRLRPCGLLVSSVSGRRCRWMSLHCQLYVCLAWNWCLRFLVAALVRWLLGPLERFLSLHRLGIAGWLTAALTLHLVWQDPFRLLIWGAVAGVVLGFWAAYHWPARRVAA